MVDVHSRRLKVLVLTSTFPRWKNDPEPAFVFELSRRLGVTYDITVLAPRSPGSENFEKMDNLRVIRFPYFFRRLENLASHSGGILNKLRSNPFNYLLVPLLLIGQLCSLFRLLQKERFDLIHAHWLIPQGLMSVIVLTVTRRCIPLLCTSHGGDLFALRGKLLNRLKCWVLNRSQGLTVVSQAMQEMVVDLGISIDKVWVMPMGTDLKYRFTPDISVKRKNNELLFVGRLVEKKGLSILLEAMPIVLSSYPSVRLRVVGSGPLENELHKRAGELSIRDNVDFVGMVPHTHLPEVYRRSTIAVFPFIIAKNGDQDGFGLVQVEAIGCGCPIISADLPVIHDIVIHEKTGLLVPSGNSKVLAEEIMKLLADDFLASELAREARKRALEHFDWEMIGKKYGCLYRKLMEMPETTVLSSN